MMELKVHCDCGQKYKFDVEPQNGRMPFEVNCPICGASGTAKANASLQQMAVFKPIDPTSATIRVVAPAPDAPAAAPRVAAAPPPISIRSTTSMPAAASSGRPGGRTTTVSQEGRDQAVVEARAKILWGDNPDEAIRFLMLRGFTTEEATEKIHAMIKERRRTIRGEGFKKIIIGSLLAFASSGALFGMWKVGFISPFVGGGVGLACVGGLWMLFNGLLKFLAPGSQGGDAAGND